MALNINFDQGDPLIRRPMMLNKQKMGLFGLGGCYHISAFVVHLDVHTVEKPVLASKKAANELVKRSVWVQVQCDDKRVVWWHSGTGETSFLKPWRLMYRPKQLRTDYQEIVGRNGTKIWYFEKRGAQSKLLTERPRVLELSQEKTVSEVTKSTWLDSFDLCPKNPRLTREVVGASFTEVQKSRFYLDESLSRPAFGALWYSCADQLMAPMANYRDQQARLMYGFSKHGAGTLRSCDILYMWIEASMERFCCSGKYDKQEILIEKLFESRGQAAAIWPSRLSSTQKKVIETISSAMEKQIDRLEESCKKPAVDEEEKAINTSIVDAFRRVFARKFGPKSGSNRVAYDYRPVSIARCRDQNTSHHVTTVFSAEAFKEMSDFYLRTDCIASGAIGRVVFQDSKDIVTFNSQEGAGETQNGDPSSTRLGVSQATEAASQDTQLLKEPENNGDGNETVEADIKSNAGPELGALILQFEQMAISKLQHKSSELRKLKAIVSAMSRSDDDSTTASRGEPVLFDSDGSLMPGVSVVIKTGNQSWKQGMVYSTDGSGSESGIDVQHDEEEPVDNQGDQTAAIDELSEGGNTDYSTEREDCGNPLYEKDEAGKSSKWYADEYNRFERKRVCPDGGSSQDASKKFRPEEDWQEEWDEYARESEERGVSRMDAFREFLKADKL
ncbi:hypothetical protein Vi05172_g8909 [Venturia inaequalis]|nr:hypothetical protein Vi05172_g8909 [Venturia inaequalis]